MLTLCCFAGVKKVEGLPNSDPTLPTTTSVHTYEVPKSKSSRRIIYLPEGLYTDFAQYLEIQKSIAAQYPDYNPDGYVFCQANGEPYEPRAYQDLFKRCVKQAGIASTNFHALRHTFATRSLEEGMDIVTLSRLLGHYAPSVTLDLYGHTLDDHRQSSIQKLDEVYRDNKAPQPVKQTYDQWGVTPTWSP